MLSAFVLLLGLAIVGGLVLIVVILAVIRRDGQFAKKSEKEKKFMQYRRRTPKEEEKGDPNMLPQHLLEQISKIVEEKTGIKIPRPKSIEEILASIPKEDRARLLPTLIPIVVDAIQQSTGMNMDASLALQEFLLGQGLGLSELDVAIETDAMKLEKTLAARKRYKEIAAHFREEMGEDPVVDFTEKMFTFKLVQEAFKDMQLPPGWSPQKVAGLLGKGTPDDDTAESYDDDEE